MSETAVGARILVVDDDPDVALLVKVVLERRGGYIVEVACDGAIALQMTAANQPDLVITDIEMPELNGLDLVRELRQRIPGVPVIVMTAHVSVDHAVSALRVQADEFITKPIDNAAMLETVGRLLAESSKRKQATKRQVVLAIGAHPDDVEIGVGGILAAHAHEGDDVTILTLSRGRRRQ